MAEAPAMFDQAGRATAEAVAPSPGVRRMPADCLGMRGLPEDREGLDALLTELCRRLQAAEGRPVRGARLAADLRLTGTRALRLLVAYGRIARRRHQITGGCGEGYAWTTEPAALAAASRDALRRARCYLALYCLYHVDGPQAAMARLPLDLADDGDADDLTAVRSAVSYR